MQGRNAQYATSSAFAVRSKKLLEIGRSMWWSKRQKNEQPVIIFGATLLLATSFLVYDRIYTLVFPSAAFVSPLHVSFGFGSF